MYLGILSNLTVIVLVEGSNGVENWSVWGMWPERLKFQDSISNVKDSYYSGVERVYWISRFVESRTASDN